MTVIFSDRAVNGLIGIYSNPKFYEGIPNGTTTVVTNIEMIANDAKQKGIKVEPFPKNEEEITAFKEKEVKKSETVSNSNIDDFVITGLTDITTTFEQDVRAGMPDEEILTKHGVSKRKLTAEKKKLK
jgi:hypothetical protein